MPIDVGMKSESRTMKRSSGMTKKEIVRSLILSPCYLKIKLKDRAKLVRKLSYKKP